MKIDASIILLKCEIRSELNGIGKCCKLHVLGKNEFKLRLFMLLTFKLIISTIFMYKLNWRSMLKIFLDLTQWGAKVAIVHKIRE